MNREIKFRAWDESQKYMAYQGTPDLENIQSFMHHFANKELMQFTGLTDKNGKEIYECDVVKCGYGTGNVVFKSGCFMVEWIDDKEAYLEFVFSRKGIYVREGDEQFEIIGNIYENQNF